jgi:hypothetical protein
MSWIVVASPRLGGLQTVVQVLDEVLCSRWDVAHGAGDELEWCWRECGRATCGQASEMRSKRRCECI